MEKAKTAAEKAIEFNPNSAEAHASLASIRSLYEWRWVEAGHLILRAIELNPGYATARHWYAVDYLAMLGRLEEAAPQIEMACQLDPLSQIVRESRAYLKMIARRYDEAIADYRRMLEQDPSFYKTYTSLGRAFMQRGQHAEAIRMLQQGRALAGDVPSILGVSGRHTRSQGIAGSPNFADRTRPIGKDRYVPCTCFA